MKATELIDLAKSIGLGIGRLGKTRYRYTQVVSGVVVENEFVGTWGQFVTLIRNRVEAAK